MIPPFFENTQYILTNHCHKINPLSGKFRNIRMFCGQHHRNFRKLCRQLLRKITADHVLRPKMPGVNEIHAQLFRILELIIPAITGDEGVAAQTRRRGQKSRAGSAADGDLRYFPATVTITQTLAAKFLLYSGQKIL